MQIDADRLYQSLADLGRIGAWFDTDQQLWGVNRLALTPMDGQGRNFVRQRMLDLGLQVTVDQIGNVFGRRAGRADHLAPVMVGSHIDSVPTAGRFDGCLGVLGGLEVLQTLQDAGVVTRRPLIVGFFTDEEGARFKTDMLGSAVATGRIPLREALALRDSDGLSVGEELASIGFAGDVPASLDPPHAYVECHIEQGPVLGAAGADIGVVTGVQGISWTELAIFGRAAHAGTTPMAMRRDAGVAAALINLRAHALAESGEFGALRVTMGSIQPYPGLVNIVPGKVRCTVDLRNPDEALLAEAEAALSSLCDQVERDEGVRIERRRTARTTPVPFAAGIQARVAAAADARGLSRRHLISGAGHDCQELARICQAGMVFVPGLHEGISHNPREESSREQCANGVNVLLDVVVGLAEEA